MRISGVVVASAIALIVLLLVFALVDLVTEWMWFDSLGLTAVYWTGLFARLTLFVVGACVFMALFAANVLVARRLAYGLAVRQRRAGVNATWEELLSQIGAQMARGGSYSRLINVAVLFAGGLLAFFMGLVSTGSWLIVLQFLNRSVFGVADPAFGNDVGFYVFVMPVLRAIEGWLFLAWILIGLSAVAVYAVVVTYELAVNIGQVGFPLSRGIKGHIVCLAAVGFVLIAGHHVLDMFDLVRSTRGAAYGAGFTDVNIQRPAQMVMAAAALFAAALSIAAAFGRGLRLLVVGAGVWLAVMLVVGWAFPTLVQNVDVAPNELDRERPYIGATIRSTRAAFRLDGVEEHDVAYQPSVSGAALAADRETVDNIRLWDYRPLKDTYRQIQAIRQYYQFDDVDVDRYTIDGQYRQVMLAARELVPDQLPREAQSWVSRQLQYTHGYGIVMSPVNAVSQEGLPDLIVRDIPPVGQVPITRPEIYFGRQTNHYVVTGTSTPEFDYPSGDSGVFVPQYGGRAGISVGSFLRRLLFAMKFQDVNFVLNGSFREESQLLYRRNIADRARQIAPFLRLDPDPYVVVADGALYWIQDAYTISDRYPYSEPYQPVAQNGVRRPRAFNYIRNSVKVVTSAYDGTVHFYVADPSDPLIQTYERIYPSLFVPVDDAPAAIRSHFRYPEEMFRIQAEKYRLFHIQDPRVFYLREDQWTIPKELYYNKEQPVEPYYVIMKLPGDEHPEFILILPFTPTNRDNMISWLAARSDQPEYGKMLLYKYPKDTVIYGPFQIETRMDQVPEISSQFALWNQAGSQVIRGNLLVIPVGQSALYVEPIYLQATASPLPELKRVVVANGDRIVMEASLSDAIARLFGTGPPTAAAQPAAPQAPSAPATRVSGEVAQLVAEAQDHFQRAQDALRAGDFARYGDELNALSDALNQLAQATHE